MLYKFSQAVAYLQLATQKLTLCALLYPASAIVSFPDYQLTNFLIMAYGSTPYVGMTPKKNGGQIKSAQMTRSKCLHRSVNGIREPYQALLSTSMGNRTINLLESIAKVPDRQSLKRAKSVYLQF